ncbi:hypothetical protein B9J93_22390 [Vibrio sp. V17_P4S1T151]|uniref:hypothetical protein n=1 Tax=unclassified Vibrio TaxID=2614977 RepID=UPI000B8ED672|nr:MULTISPECIES: hypothetical protein [unclassified Vibrio]OXX40376.1 hypothetical protein B9J93_22390 [Vibrio sp. V17_P4S1T151]OXX64926.1 hypothetical protein B9J89_03350 [Vibrio sp. V15_P4S5T153]
MSSDVQFLLNETSKIEDIVRNLPGLIINKFDIKNENGEISISIKVKNLSEYENFIRNEYIKYANRYRLPIMAIDEVLIADNGTFKVLGWEQKNRLYPIIIRELDTFNEYKLSISQFHNLYDNALKEPL